jgi:hypothetical protein
MAKTKDLSRVWRVQRDQIYPDVITCLTHSRQALFLKCNQDWEQRLLGRSTIYVRALVSGAAGKHRLIILREVQKETGMNVVPNEVLMREQLLLSAAWVREQLRRADIGPISR